MKKRKLKRVYYEEVPSCISCPYSHKYYCRYSGDNEEPISELLFREKCRLPSLEEVEDFTRYVSDTLSLKVCGNCVHWNYEGFNREVRGVDFGWCSKVGGFPNCNETRICDKFEMIGTRPIGQKKLM